MDRLKEPHIMHSLEPRAVRRLSGLACLTLVAVALTAITTAPAGAQTAPPQSGCQGTAPVLDLGNPNPGDTLPLGNTMFSGLAFDPASPSGSGISSVELFIGSRESGGTLLGSVVPGSMDNPREWQVTASLPTNATGQHDFVAYAISSVTGDETSVSVPIFIGPAPTPTPSGSGATPVVLGETVSSTCKTTTTTSVGAAGGAPALLQLPMGPHAAPSLSLGNPSDGSVLSNGDIVIQGLAWDPAATTGSGVDSVQVFLGSRDDGGILLGSGVPGANGVMNARAFSVKASIPNSISGGHDFVAYARSALTGEETVVSVPVFVGAAPTATPRPTS